MPTGGVDVLSPSGQVQEPKGKAYEEAESVDVAREAKYRLETLGIFIGPEHLRYVGEVLGLKIVVYEAAQKRFLCAFADETHEPGKEMNDDEALDPENGYMLHMH